jgi:hypothetical protein
MPTESMHNVGDIWKDSTRPRSEGQWLVQLPTIVHYHTSRNKAIEYLQQWIGYQYGKGQICNVQEAIERNRLANQ